MKYDKMKKNIDTRTLLFENMAKLNPGFKLLNANNLKKLVTESENNVINSKHKRIDESFGTQDYRMITDKLKKKIDELLSQNDFDSLDALYRLLVPKSERTTLAEQQTPDNAKKSELLKGKIDFLAATNHYDIIDKLSDILDKIFPSTNEPEYS
jgi:hypothetical protein